MTVVSAPPVRVTVVQAAEGSAAAGGERCLGALDGLAAVVEAGAGVAARVEGERDGAGGVPGAAGEVDALAGGGGGVRGEGERVVAVEAALLVAVTVLSPLAVAVLSQL